MNPLTEVEQAARDNLVRIMAEVALQVDPVWVDMNMRLRNFDLALGYRVRRGDYLCTPEIELILEEAWKLEKEMKEYKQAKLQTT